MDVRNFDKMSRYLSKFLLVDTQVTIMERTSSCVATLDACLFRARLIIPSRLESIHIYWNSLTRPSVLKTLPKLKIRGGKMPGPGASPGTQSTVKR